MNTDSYLVRRPSRSHFITVRGLRHHVLEWGDASMATQQRPTLVMQHGWMDVAASFQFVVDALPSDRHVIAFDWRGFGLTDASGSDSYWVADYLGDLDGVLDQLCFERPGALPTIDLLGHSMGGNVVMLYAGIRPQRIRRLINLEGFGMPVTRPTQAPKQLLHWLDELKEPAEMRDYDDLAGVAKRLRKTNPLLSPARADWLAQHWSRQRVTVQSSADGSVDGSAGRFEILGDPAHKRRGPLLYQVEEVLACWKQITAPLMWVEGDQSDPSIWWGTRYSKAEFHERLSVVANVQKHLLAPAGHMIHHDQPEALAQHIEAFLQA